MKKSILFCFGILILMSVVTACAEDTVPFENPVYTRRFIAKQEQNLADVEALFPEIILQEPFDEDKAPEISHAEACEVTSQVINGQEEQEIFAYEIGQDFLNGSGSSFAEKQTASDFYVSLDFQLLEQEGEDTVFVWFSYAPENPTDEKNNISGFIRYPYDIHHFTDTNSSIVYQFTDPVLDNEPHTLELVHRDSYTSVYIDHHFIAGFADTFEGPFTPKYGIGLKPGGEYAKAAFDNMVFRSTKKMSEPQDTAEPTAVPEEKKSFALNVGWHNPTYDADFIRQQEQLLDNLDTLFPKTVVKYTFDSPQKPDHSQFDGFTFSTKDTNGHREVSITAHKPAIPKIITEVGTSSIPLALI